MTLLMGASLVDGEEAITIESDYMQATCLVTSSTDRLSFSTGERVWSLHTSVEPTASVGNSASLFVEVVGIHCLTAHTVHNAAAQKCGISPSFRRATGYTVRFRPFLREQGRRQWRLMRARCKHLRRR